MDPEIKAYQDGAYAALNELLAEIDALRKENNLLQATLLPWNLSAALEYRSIIGCADIAKANDQLRAENEKLKEELKEYEGHCSEHGPDCPYFEEVKKLKAALRQEFQNNDEMGCEFTYVITLKEECKKRRERIEKLRQSLEHVKTARFNYVIKDEGPFRSDYAAFSYGMKKAFTLCDDIALKALQADNEDAKG